jgi:aryl-alcohol dehydrogenase-like predicted oxidoreductase
MKAMKIDRRQLLKSALVGTCGAILGDRVLGQATAASKDAADPFELVELGKTGLKVSRIGFGTGMRGSMRESNQTRLGKDKFVALLKTAYQKGVRFFDLADMYGSHEHLGAAMKDIPRDKIAFSTKIWWRRGGIPENDRPDADVIVERFRKELNTDVIDMVLLHCVSSATWPKDLAKYMETLDKLKAKKVIRAHGVSCHSLEALEAAAECDWVDSVHSRINAYGDAMDADPEKVAPVLKKIHKAGKGVVGMKLIGEGRYRNDQEKRDKSIRYVLDLGCVDTMVVGFEAAGEIDDFSARVRKARTAKA